MQWKKKDIKAVDREFVCRQGKNSILWIRVGTCALKDIKTLSFMPTSDKR